MLNASQLAERFDLRPFVPGPAAPGEVRLIAFRSPEESALAVRIGDCADRRGARRSAIGFGWGEAGLVRPDRSGGRGNAAGSTPEAGLCHAEIGRVEMSRSATGDFAGPSEIVLPRLGAGNRAAGAAATAVPLAGPGGAESGPAASGLATSGPAAACRPANSMERGFDGLAAGLKRLADLVGAVVLLALALPLLVSVAAALWVDSPGPLLFVQRRIGRHGRSFPCLKLRTMRPDAEAQLAALLAACPRARAEWAADRKLRQDPRVSPLGRLVRKLSIDELPQLANVVAGQMSLIGPRPIVAAEIGRYGRFYADYCAVKPGLTGLWQVSGRNDVGYGDRVQFDRHYARHASLLLDLRIALRTVPAVLGASGSY